jgi:hypothetical protein
LFVLSAGILESEWCLKELRSAIKNKKKLVIVRQYTYKLPNPLPPHVADLENFFTKTPTFTWIAEYHNHCVAKLKSTCLGPPDAVIDQLKVYVKKNGLESDIQNGVIAHRKEISIPDWNGTLNSFFHG